MGRESNFEVTQKKAGSGHIGTMGRKKISRRRDEIVFKVSEVPFYIPGNLPKTSTRK